MLNQGSFFIIQRNGETAALFGLAAQRNLTAVPFDNPSHDGQTQTGNFFVFSVTVQYRSQSKTENANESIQDGVDLRHRYSASATEHGRFCRFV